MGMSLKFPPGVHSIVNYYYTFSLKDKACTLHVKQIALSLEL